MECLFLFAIIGFISFVIITVPVGLNNTCAMPMVIAFADHDHVTRARRKALGCCPCAALHPQQRRPSTWRMMASTTVVVVVMLLLLLLLMMMMMIMTTMLCKGGRVTH